MQTALFTIVSNNYLHYARTMLQSARLHHPDWKLFCVIADRDLSHAAAHSLEFEAVPLDVLRLPHDREFPFQYSIVEFNTAVKPWAIEYLMDRGHQKVVYVDPDIFFYGEMTDVDRMLSAECDLILTPHLLAPVTDEGVPSELDIRRAGAYNLGFCAVRDSANARDFLRWWQGKLTRNCFIDLERGVFVDQSWMDLVPGLFGKVGILRNAGYNVAYWNIAQRPLRRAEDGRYFVRDDPLVFFHFSGIDPLRPESFSRYQDRFTLSTLGAAEPLVRDYARTVLGNGARLYAANEYGFGNFATGEKLPDAFRKLYRTSEALRQRMGADPFQRPEAMLESWTAICHENWCPTNAMMALWNGSRELQRTFPMSSGESIREFYRWFVVDPSVAEAYSSSVLMHHATLIQRFSREQEREWSRSAHRVHSLYVRILERAPDPGGLRSYVQLCKTRSGFLRTWRDIGLSEESRKISWPAARMLKALVLSIFDEFSPHVHPDDASTTSDHQWSGIFPPEPDSAAMGVWVSDRLVVSLATAPGETIRLEGIYFPDLIKRQTGSGDSTLSFWIGQDKVHFLGLESDGEFATIFSAPRENGVIGASLVITCSKSFVPRTIGAGEDSRKLSWRMKRLSTGDTVLFDCARASDALRPG
jgi:hypothetical protein